MADRPQTSVNVLIEIGGNHVGDPLVVNECYTMTWYEPMCEGTLRDMAAVALREALAKVDDG